MRYLILVLFLCGCSDFSPRQLEDYRCTKEQLELVQHQAETCYKSTYIGSYCYKTAVQSHCDDLRKKQ